MFSGILCVLSQFHLENQIFYLTGNVNLYDEQPNILLHSTNDCIDSIHGKECPRAHELVFSLLFDMKTLHGFPFGDATETS